MKMDFLEAEEFLESFEKLSRRSKLLIFAYIFSDPLIDVHGLIYYYLEFLYGVDQYKSPIEELFAIAYNIRLMMEGYPYKEIVPLFPQACIHVNENTYFADFLIDAVSTEGFMFEHDYKLVIECDGHEFHEKTKEQVERRNNRDLDLKSAGYDVLHFSGSQIYKNPMKCADETFRYIKNKIGEVEVTYGNIQKYSDVILDGQQDH